MVGSTRPLFIMITLLLCTFLAFNRSILPVARAATIHVPTDQPTIQKAINAASINDTIVVAPGIYHELVMLNKTVHLVGSNVNSTIIDGQGQGTVVQVTVNKAWISGFTIQNADIYGHAIELSAVKNVNVTGNTISADLTNTRALAAAIDMYLANGTIIDGNTFTHDLYAVNMTYSTNNRLTNNLMSTGVVDAVEVVNSPGNLIFQNSFVRDEDGVDINGPLSVGNNITRNLFREESFAGAFLLGRPKSNVFAENTFLLDHIGVNMQNVTDRNVYYHNSFLRSGFRHVNHVFSGDGNLDVWDNRSLGGPKLGGNYWDDFRGTDGDNDGIGDTPYTGAAGYPADNYPLMSPFTPVPLAVVGVSFSPNNGQAPFRATFTADVLGTLKPFVYAWSFGDGSPVDSSVSPSHTFGSPGNYTVTLTVADASGASGTKSLSVIVSPANAVTTLLPYLAVLVVGLGIVGLLYYRRRRRRLRSSSEENSPKKSRRIIVLL